MKVVIVFDGRSGTTGAVAEQMAEVVRSAGHECEVVSTLTADPARVGRADAICIGSPAQGFLVFGLHASEGTLGLIGRLSLHGKPVAVFTTYGLAVGGTLRQLAAAVESAGGMVTGMYRSRGSKADQSFSGWVSSLEG